MDSNRHAGRRRIWSIYRRSLNNVNIHNKKRVQKPTPTYLPGLEVLSRDPGIGGGCWLDDEKKRDPVTL
jgi:hypothetical protein